VMQENRRRAAGGDHGADHGFVVVSRLLRVPEWRLPPTNGGTPRSANLVIGYSVSFSLHISAFDNQTLARVRIFRSRYRGYPIQREIHFCVRMWSAAEC